MKKWRCVGEEGKGKERGFDFEILLIVECDVCSTFSMNNGGQLREKKIVIRKNDS